MNCSNCNQPLTEGAKFCYHCGAPVVVSAEPEVQVPPVQPEPVSAPVEPTPVVPPVQPQPSVVYVTQTVQEQNIPSQYTPLTAWQYFWLQILFSIPIVGFVFLIVFSFKSSNLNRRSFARSYWCWVVVTLGLGLAVILLAALFGASLDLF